MSVIAYAYEPAAHLYVTGEDAADFLQSQFSNELRPFESGRSSYGLWLDVKGRVVADSWIYCEDAERFRIISERSDGALIREKLESHIVADEVEIESGAPLAGLAVIGSTPDASSRASLDGALILESRRAGSQSRDIFFPDATSREDFLSASGLEAVRGMRFDAERVRAGIAGLHAEVCVGDMPGEAGLVGTVVSLTKGCFLGQEVVARMHHVGRPQRGLFLVRGDGPLPQRLSGMENEEGKTLGELRTVLAADGGWQGVAMLKTRYAEAGLRLSIDEKQGCATVVGPFGAAHQDD